MDDAKWYVVHTYSGYENKVKANLEKTVENRNLESLLLDIQVPMEEVISCSSTLFSTGLASLTYHQI